MDEILTGFHCVNDDSDTVLLSDELFLNSDFIVLGKFLLGCGVVLQDMSLKSTSWTARKERRMPVLVVVSPSLRDFFFSGVEDSSSCEGPRLPKKEPRCV